MPLPNTPPQYRAASSWILTKLRWCALCHEIDQTLNLVKYWHERGGTHRLAELRNNGLLPPDLLFVVSIADRAGEIVDSTRAAVGQNVASLDFFRQQRDTDTFFIGQLPRGATGDAKLQFSRRLTTDDGRV